jgi:coenzyme PQQ precursor peptide PqqA
MKIMRPESAICGGRGGHRSGEWTLTLGNTPDPRNTFSTYQVRRDTMWTKPEFTEMRFGFEVTMYIYNR